MLPRRRLVVPAALLALAVLAPIGVTPTSATARSARPPITRAPAAGPTGTEVIVRGSGCLVPGSSTPGDGVVVRLRDGRRILAFDTLTVRDDGSWSGRLTIPAGTPTGGHVLDARCAAIGFEDRDPVTYARSTFTVTGEGAGAESTPRTPPFSGGIEDFAEYDGQSTCSPSTKPGMSRFMRMVMRHYGGGNSGVGRGCSIGGTSEHKEGRAWDWRMNAGRPQDRRRVSALLRWLFATDVECNRYANARRVGLMYVIWNRRMFRLYDTEQGWSPYTGSSPHTDHVHFSLTRAGGAGRVSYWNPTYRAPAGWTPESHGADDLAVNEEWDDVQPLAGDFDGNEVADLLWYRPGVATDEVWFGREDGGFAQREIRVDGNFVPLVADFNGDCRSDVYWYGPGPERDVEWRGRRNRGFRAVVSTMDGVHDRPVVGDFNGDRFHDILWYGPNAQPDARLWLGSAQGFRRGVRTIGGDHEPLVGDFDGDRRDDVIWFGEGAETDLIWWGKKRGFTAGELSVPLTAQPLVGDYNGDQRADLLWYGPGEEADTLWIGRPNRTFRKRVLDIDRTDARPVVGNFDGEGGDDILWHASAEAEDRFWWY